MAVDLPCEDESAGWRDYADFVVDALGERQNVVVVGHSLGGSRHRSSAPHPADLSSSWPA